MQKEIDALIAKVDLLTDGQQVFGNILNVQIIISKTVNDFDENYEVYYTTHYIYRGVNRMRGVNRIVAFVAKEELGETIKYNIDEVIRKYINLEEKNSIADAKKYTITNIGQNGNNIKKLIPAKDVFSKDTIDKIMSDIVIDEEERLTVLWEEYADDKEDMPLEDKLEMKRDAINYSLYAYNLSFYEFMQEFDNYIQHSDTGDAEYFDFMENLTEGIIELSIRK